LIKTDFPDLKLIHRGKVRDLYQVDDHLLMVATDRISAFDVVMDDPIPNKGAIHPLSFSGLISRISCRTTWSLLMSMLSRPNAPVPEELPDAACPLRRPGPAGGVHRARLSLRVLLAVVTAGRRGAASTSPRMLNRTRAAHTPSTEGALVPMMRISR
jgi:hypothetical protein